MKSFSTTTLLMLIIFMLSSSFLLCVQTANVVDLAGKFTNYTCVKEQGYERAIIRGYHSYGAIDTDMPNNVKLSNEAGLATDIYMFPCRGKNATLQVQELIKYLKQIEKGEMMGSESHDIVKDGIEGNAATSSSMFANIVGTIWLDIETNPSHGCSWNLGDAQSNCEFTKQLVKALAHQGRAVGIYASAYMWNQIFGSKQACLQLNTLPLWYAHYDNKKSMDDYALNPFGGWTHPVLKQYAGDAVVCGYKLDLSWY